jgi:type II secretory ATPase GspE/PulE/Tfp pilus assembly ATPase PilB-like protein
MHVTVSTSLPLLLAEQSLILLSLYKPLLTVALFVPWAIIVSKIYDKHAGQFFLPREQWNLGHMAAGTIALAAIVGMSFAMPGSEGAFWAGLGIAIVVLIADLYAYMHVANRDDRVPERFHIKLKMAALGDAKKDKKAEAKAFKSRYAIRAADEKGKYSKTFAVPAAETPEAELRAAAEKLYEQGLKSRASQTDIVPTGKDNMYQVRYLVDGVYVPGDTMPAANASRLIDFWKAAAALDVADRRRKQQTNIQVEDGASGGGIKRVVRVSSIGAQGGPRMTLLMDPESSVTKKIHELGLLDVQMEEVKRIVADGKGVVLVTAPPDGGRTTLLYSLLAMHDAYTSNVQTVEMDQQATLEGVRHNLFDAQSDSPLPSGSTGPEFSTLVRSILRRDPQVVGVSELPDIATAKEISKADHERTRIYVSFRSTDPIAAAQAWVKMVGDTRDAANCIHAIITARLVRKLCTNCRASYPPSPDMLKRLGIPEGKVQQLFKKGGQVMIKNKPEICPACQGVGYMGQDGLYEIAFIGPEERGLIAQSNFQGLKAALRKRQIPTVQQVAIRKAVDGVTSVEEVMRVTTTEKSVEPAKATV